MAIACGLASMGAMLTGDVFDFDLFTSLVGITNVGIVAEVNSRHVQMQLPSMALSQWQEPYRSLETRDGCSYTGTTLARACKRATGSVLLR